MAEFKFNPIDIAKGKIASPEAAAQWKEAVEIARESAQLDLAENFDRAKALLGGVNGVSDDVLKQLLGESYSALHLNVDPKEVRVQLLRALGVSNLGNVKNLNIALAGLDLDPEGELASQYQGLDPAKVKAELDHLNDKKLVKSRRLVWQDVRRGAPPKPASSMLVEKLKGMSRAGEKVNKEGVPLIRQAKRTFDEFPNAPVTVDDVVKGVKSKGGFTVNPLVRELQGIATGVTNEAPPTITRRADPVADILRGKMGEGFQIPKGQVSKVRELVRFGRSAPDVINKDQVTKALLDQRLIEETPARRQFARILSGRPESISLNDRFFDMRKIGKPIPFDMNREVTPLRQFAGYGTVAKPAPSMLRRAGGVMKRNPLVMGLLGGLAFEGGLAAMDAVGSVAGTKNVDDMVRQSEPSMREIIQRIYLQQRAKQGRALELKANPHLAALERHDAELAAGGVPGTVTF